MMFFFSPNRTLLLIFLLGSVLKTAQITGFDGFPQWIRGFRAYKPSLIAGGLALASWTAPSSVKAEIPLPSSKTYGIVDGRLLRCERKSNCVSTSSINLFDKYSRPWAFAQTQSTDEIYTKLKTLLSNDPYLRLVESDDTARYLHAEAKSAVPPTGIDDIEFLVKDTDHIITYRSNSRDVITVSDEVVSDGGSNRNRLRAIRDKLGVAEMNNDDGVDTYMKEVNKRNIFQIMQQASEPSEVNFLD